jgi:choline dehydrogenase-like flavoprotein
MISKKYEYIVVGSGAGGACISNELAKKGKSVLIIEKGEVEKKLGTFKDAVRVYDGNKLTKIPKKSKEGVIIYRAFMAGGTTVVSMANGVRSLEKELLTHKIVLDDEFSECERELGVKQIPDSLISKAGLNIKEAANSLGYAFENMPKFVNVEKCKSCGHCSMGCFNDAKWTSYNHVTEAQKFGADVVFHTEVEKVITDHGRSKGVIVRNNNQTMNIESDFVIIAAGGIGTPVILQNSGFTDAGTNLFIDILVNTYGVTERIGMVNEPQMSLVNLDFHEEDGFLLSSYIQPSREIRLIELGVGGYTMPTNRMIGIMTKISDEPSGRVYSDGTITKDVTVKDKEKINKGTKISQEILIKAGAKPETIKISAPQGAHPGGTAAIGKIVNAHLETECKNLFVCDASVLPQSPGLPPILTILALAKRLGKELLM